MEEKLGGSLRLADDKQSLKGELIAKSLDMGAELVSKRPEEVGHYGDGTSFKMKMKRRAYDMLRQESVMCN